MRLLIAPHDDYITGEVSYDEPHFLLRRLQHCRRAHVLISALMIALLAATPLDCRPISFILSSRLLFFILLIKPAQERAAPHRRYG